MPAPFLAFRAQAERVAEQWGDLVCSMVLRLRQPRSGRVPKAESVGGILHPCRARLGRQRPLYSIEPASSLWAGQACCGEVGRAELVEDALEHGREGGA